jgi:hypothetical protein
LSTLLNSHCSVIELKHDYYCSVSAADGALHNWHSLVTESADNFSSNTNK